MIQITEGYFIICLQIVYVCTDIDSTDQNVTSGILSVCISYFTDITRSLDPAEQC